jgi:predicted secreted protein
MPSITPKSGFGTVLKIGNGASPEVFTSILGIRNIQGPAQDMEIIDATSHSSSGAYREKVASFKDPGNVTFDLIYDSTNAQHQLLFTQYAAREITNFQQIMTDAGAEQYAYGAFVKSINPAAPIDDLLTYAITLEISGPVVNS